MSAACVTDGCECTVESPWWSPRCRDCIDARMAAWRRWASLIASSQEKGRSDG